MFTSNPARRRRVMGPPARDLLIAEELPESDTVPRLFRRRHRFEYSSKTLRRLPPALRRRWKEHCRAVPREPKLMVFCGTEIVRFSGGYFTRPVALKKLSFLFSLGERPFHPVRGEVAACVGQLMQSEAVRAGEALLRKKEVH